MQYAGAINHQGQIAGTGISPSGYQHAFLLTPAAAVPEPGTVAMWLLGLPLAAALARRRAPTCTAGACT